MPEQDQTTALVRAAQSGDDRAFAELVRSFEDIAVAYATSLLGDYHLAEDAAQEAFIHAYRVLPSLREPAAFAAWLRTIVFKFCDRITRRRDHGASALESVFEIASTDPSPYERLELAETRQALRHAIATLSENEQRVVLLYYLGDQSLSAIAGFLNVPPNTVKTRLHSARRRLRAHMSDIENNLGSARPSGDPRFAEKVQRLIPPRDLQQKTPWIWSPGIGIDVWEMFVACIMGDLEAVKRLVARDPSLVRSHYEYRTPLSFAVRENQLDVAAYLLDQGAARVMLGEPLEMARDRDLAEMAALLERKFAELHSASAQGEPVAAAIRACDLGTMRRLLDERPALLREGDARSNQPLHWAVMTRQIDAIDELLTRGADINAERLDGARPIHLTNGDYHYRGWRDVPDDVRATPDDVFRHLVARGAEIDIGMAAYTGDIARVAALLERDASLANRVSEYGSYYIGCGAPLKNAVAGGHLDIVKLLLAHGADPNLPEEGIAPHGHALYAAVAAKRHDIASLLLEHGAYPNPPVESSADAVWVAIRNGDRRMIELLASHGAIWEIALELPRALTYQEIVATGLRRTTELLAYYGDIETATALFESDPELADDPAALRAAAGQRHEAFVSLLLRHHPDLVRRVSLAKPREMVTMLFDLGMDPNLPNWLRITPLHHYAGDGNIESATLYLDHGADLHARDEEYQSTPLAWAARQGQWRMVEFLLRRGAKLRLPDDPPWATPLAWAVRRGHHDIVRLLADFEKSGSLPAQTLSEYESLALDLTLAYGTGDDRAYRRIVDHFRITRPMLWDRPSLEVRLARLRRAVRAQLGEPPHAGDARPTLDLDDARALIARAEGFASWAALAERLRR